MQKIQNQIFTYFFSFLSALIVYGFTLTNFSLTMDSESQIDSNYSLHLGRWGTNLVRYLLFHGLYPYYTLLFGLIFLSLAAVEMTKILNLKKVYSYVFILLFLSFPQHAYQFAFTMQADAIGLGYFISVYAVSLYLKLNSKNNIIYFGQLLSIILLLTFTIAIYQTLIYIPTMLFALWFFQKLNEDNLDIKQLWKEVFLFIGLIFISVILYVISVKIFFPTGKINSYLNSYMSEGNNILKNFIILLKNNYLGKFYYGQNSFILVLFGILFSIFFIIKYKKLFGLKLLTLVFIIIYPFTIALFTKETNNPPRLFVGTTLSFAFILTFVMTKIKFKNNLNPLFIVLVIFLWNAFFINNMFYNVNKIFKRDLILAEKINDRIHNVILDFNPSIDHVYFYGKPTPMSVKGTILPNSDVFEVSILRESGGSNYRIADFFKFNNIAEYKLVENQEELNTFMDSIPEMPVFPDEGSIRKFNKTVVVKLGNIKGQNLSFEKGEDKPIIIKKDLKLVNFDQSIPENKDIQGSIDEMSFQNNHLHIQGWAAYEKNSSNMNNIFIILFNNEHSFIIDTNTKLRPDVTNYFSNGIDYDKSGFIADFDLPQIPKGVYDVRIRLIQSNSENDGYKTFNKTIEIK